MASASTIHPTANESSLAHHFESHQQQFDAGKLGMWLFLVTEILFFSGLFVAYAIYRINHPEVFVDARQHLSTPLGAFNTAVLLFSSLTMAWAVRSAQLGDHKTLSRLIVVTLACASLFLGVKTIEYSHKWSEGLLWAGAFSYGSELAVQSSKFKAMAALSLPALLMTIAGLLAWLASRRRNSDFGRAMSIATLLVGLAFFVGLSVGYGVESLTHASNHHAHEMEHHGHSSMAQEEAANVASEPALIGVFFSIYFAMTGVHALHIIIGMGVMFWLLARSLRQHFGPSYFGPVDYVGLYWHLVDLVWIYLFPLLYLIG